MRKPKNLIVSIPVESIETTETGDIRNLDSVRTLLQSMLCEQAREHLSSSISKSSFDFWGSDAGTVLEFLNTHVGTLQDERGPVKKIDLAFKLYQQTGSKIDPKKILEWITQNSIRLGEGTSKPFISTTGNKAGIVRSSQLSLS